MNTISLIIKNYREKKWPSLEVNNFSKAEIIFFASFYIADLLYCSYHYTHFPNAEIFLMPLLIPVMLLLLKSRLFFITFLISVQFLVAFWGLGNLGDVINYVGAFILILLTLSNVLRGYYLLIITMFFFFMPSFQGYQVQHIIALFLAFSLIIHQELINKANYDRKHKLSVLVMVLLIWVNLSILWSQNLGAVAYRYLDVISLFLAYWLTLVIINDEAKLLKTFKVWAAIGVFYAFARGIVPPSGSGSGSESAIELFTAKNTVSSLLNFATFALMALTTIKIKKIPTSVLLGCIMFLIFVNFIVGSKAGLGSAAIGIVLYYILLDKKRSKSKKILLNIATVMIIIFLLAQIPLVPLLYMNLKYIPLPSDIPQEFQTLLFRFEQWDYAKQMLQEQGNYITGLGMSGYYYLYGYFYDVSSVPQPWMSHPHSLYVHVFADYGLIGLMIFMILMITLFWRMRAFMIKSRNEPFRVLMLAIYAGIFSFFVHAIVDWDLNNKRLWIFIGMAVATMLIDRNLNHPEAPLPSSQQEGI